MRFYSFVHFAGNFCDFTLFAKIAEINTRENNYVTLIKVSDFTRSVRGRRDIKHIVAWAFRHARMRALA